jgi:DNA-binding response OmpR family regulator
MSRTDTVPPPAVLIVEDDATIVHYLHLGLEGHGYSATSATTGSPTLSSRGSSGSPGSHC